MCFSEDNGYRILGCYIDLFLLPLVCVVGLVLNWACLLVFSSHRSHPIVPALIVLSICDLLQLLLSLFVLFLPALHDFTEADGFGSLSQLAYLSTGLLSPLLLASNCASIWTITYISIQRHQAILRPLSSVYQRSRRCRPLILITLAALLFNASKWAEYDWNWVENVDEFDNSSTVYLFHQPSELAMDTTYRKLFDHFLYPVCVYLIPLLLLSVLNFRILTNISLNRISFDHKSRIAQERRSVILLISIVTLFFLCHTGGLIYRFLDPSSFSDTELLVLLRDIVNLLFNINSFANPMLYFFFTRQFRDLRSTFFQNHFSTGGSRSGSVI